jgi:predicted acyltransferase
MRWRLDVLFPFFLFLFLLSEAASARLSKHTNYCEPALPAIRRVLQE